MRLSIAHPLDYSRNRFDYSCKPKIAIILADERKSVGFFYVAPGCAPQLQAIYAENLP
jgi:hypothetical protein